MVGPQIAMESIVVRPRSPTLTTVTMSAKELAVQVPRGSHPNKPLDKIRCTSSTRGAIL